ncbi:MAG: DUF1858 domain-containing protein [Clostridia bacterium]|nr:DUF1858 domain-containing protein [Clostridia bacterium]
MISKDMIITDFVNQYPDKVSILMEAGFPCIGCMFSGEETIEMGCLEVGIDVYDLLDKLNEDQEDYVPLAKESTFEENTISADSDNNSNTDTSSEATSFTSGIKED